MVFSEIALSAHRSPHFITLEGFGEVGKMLFGLFFFLNLTKQQQLEISHKSLEIKYPLSPAWENFDVPTEPLHLFFKTQSNFDGGWRGGKEITPEKSMTPDWQRFISICWNSPSRISFAVALHSLGAHQSVPSAAAFSCAPLSTSFCRCGYSSSQLLDQHFLPSESLWKSPQLAKPLTDVSALCKSQWCLHTPIAESHLSPPLYYSSCSILALPHFARLLLYFSPSQFWPIQLVSPFRSRQRALSLQSRCSYRLTKQP